MQTEERGGLKRVALGYILQVPLLRNGYDIHLVYRDIGGGLLVGGLAYGALFALIPSLVLVVAAISWLVDDPAVRADAIRLVGDALPAFKDVASPALDGARQVATASSIVAIATFAWAASGLYVSLTRAMERFFPGERVGTVLARLGGVVVVVLMVVGVLAGVLVAGVVSVVAQALGIDESRLLGLVGGVSALAVATAIVFAVYRIIPAAPPSARAASLPALLVGTAIGLMTLLYSVISPWLVSGYQAFGVMASVFVALIWLRVVFLAMIYGAAMAKHRDSSMALETAGSNASGLSPDKAERED
jgi:uncharacterized BrkB/YihY/UPF0761 family membrane protein